MRQRVTFGTKEQRRDQRRPVSIAGSIAGARVDLVDLSISGIGGGDLSLRGGVDVAIEEGQHTILEFAGADGTAVRLPITIERIDQATGEFGASITSLSDSDFDAIERLMFPRRGGANA